MNEFLIQKETLTNIADKFRDYLYEVGDNTHMIDPQFKSTYEDQLAEGAVNFTFYEEFDAAGHPADQGTYPDGSKDGGFLMCDMRRNDKGHLVPVIISEGMHDSQEDQVSAYYYVGIDVIEGVTYDKWRRIEGVDINTGGDPDPDENYMWESPFRSYLYTNRIVVPVGENITQYNPTDFGTKVDDVYKAGAASGTGEGDIQLPELVNPGTSSDLLSGKQLIDGEGNIVEGTFSIDAELTIQDDLIAQIRTAASNLPDAGTSEEIALQVKVVTPAASSQIITADDGYDGLSKVTVNGDENLIPANIVSGKAIFGVSGTAEVSSGGNGETNDQTCTVTFDNESLSSDCNILALIATVLENGVRKTYAYHQSFRYPNLQYLLTLPNVVCGTKIYLTASIYQIDSLGAYVEIDGSAVYDSHLVLDNFGHVLLTFTAPSVANENCTIYYAYDA